MNEEHEDSDGMPSSDGWACANCTHYEFGDDDSAPLPTGGKSHEQTQI